MKKRIIPLALLSTMVLTGCNLIKEADAIAIQNIPSLDEILVEYLSNNYTRATHIHIADSIWKDIKAQNQFPYTRQRTTYFIENALFMIGNDDEGNAINSGYYSIPEEEGVAQPGMWHYTLDGEKDASTTHPQNIRLDSSNTRVNTYFPSFALLGEAVAGGFFDGAFTFDSAKQVWVSKDNTLETVVAEYEPLKESGEACQFTLAEFMEGLCASCFKYQHIAGETEYTIVYDRVEIAYTPAEQGNLEQLKVSLYIDTEASTNMVLDNENGLFATATFTDKDNTTIDSLINWPK